MNARTIRELSIFLFALLLCSGCQTPANSNTGHYSVEDRSVKNDQRSRDLYLLVIAQLIEYDKPHAALAHLDEFDRLYGTVPQSHNLRGDAWFALREFANAGREYQSVAEGPLSGYGQHGLGNVAAAREDWPTAARYFEQAVRSQPTNATFLNDLGRVYSELGRSADADFVLGKARELSWNAPAPMGQTDDGLPEKDRASRGVSSNTADRTAIAPSAGIGNTQPVP